jgi:hypothetical protein
LAVHWDFDHVRGHRPQFSPGLFAPLDRLGHFFGPRKRHGNRYDADAFVLAQHQITTRFKAVSEGRRKRDSTLGVELTLIPSNETFH